MHLTVSSVSDESAFLPLANFANAIGHAINRVIENESYGAITRLMLVIVAVDDDIGENSAFATRHNKCGTYKHPVTADRVKY